MTTFSGRKALLLVTAVLLVSGGIGTGYAPGQEKPASDLAKERLAVLAEMERLQCRGDASRTNNAPFGRGGKVAAPY